MHSSATMKNSNLRLIIGVAIAVLFSLPARAEILKVVVNDTIQPISAEYIARAIEEARRRNDQAVLIEINTPGGLVSSTREIIEKISASSVPVIVYVTPTGGHAGSAGIFILESADIAAMAPGTAAGAAHPVTLIGPVQVKPDEEMNRKIENDAAALIRSVASKRGRNVEGAESAVRESKSFTEQEALAGHLIDYVASSPEDLFHQMQGKSFKRFNGESASLNLTAQPVLTPLMHLLGSQPRTLYDLFEVRALLEAESARLAALRGTLADFVLITRRYDEMMAAQGTETSASTCGGSGTMI